MSRSPKVGGRTQRNVKFAAVAGVAVLLTSVLAACGSDDDGDSTGSSGATKSPIVIGTAYPADNAVTNFPGIPAALKAAAKTINDDGGINGHPIEVFECNTNQTANGELGCARKAVAKKVAAMVAPSVSITTPEYYKILQHAGIPEIGATGADPSQYNTPQSYTIDFTMGTFNPCVGSQFAADNTAAKKAVLVSAKSTAAFFEPMLKAQAASAGLEWDGLIDVPDTVADFAPYVAQAQDKGADMVVLILAGSGPQAFVKASSNAGATYGICTSWGFNGSGDWSGLGDAEKNVYLGATTQPVSADGGSELMKTMVSSLTDAYKGGDENANPDPAKLQMSTVQAWLATYTFSQVAKGISGDVDAASMTKALPTAKVTYDGVIPDIDFSNPQGCDPMFTRVFNSTTFLWKWDPDNSTYKQVGDGADILHTSVCP